MTIDIFVLKGDLNGKIVVVRFFFVGYMYSSGTVNSIFVEIQPDFTNIKNDPRSSVHVLTCTAKAIRESSDEPAYSPSLARTFTFHTHIM